MASLCFWTPPCPLNKSTPLAVTGPHGQLASPRAGYWGIIETKGCSGKPQEYTLGCLAPRLIIISVSYLYSSMSGSCPLRAVHFIPFLIFFFWQLLYAVRYLNTGLPQSMPNAQCRSILIKIQALIPMPINSNQCRSMPINSDRQWSALLFHTRRSVLLFYE